MADDPLLRFLLDAERHAAEAHEAAKAALAAYRGGAPAEPDAGRFVPLKEAVPIFGVKEVTLRRDVLKKGLGRKEPGRNGKIYVDVTTVSRYRVAKV